MDEIKRLQRCINDLVSVLALPAIWAGGEAGRIVRTLLGTLQQMLNLDLIYARLSETSGSHGDEFMQAAEWCKLSPDEIRAMIAPWLKEAPRHRSHFVKNSIGEGNLSIVILPLGLQGEFGQLVAASRRDNFPEQAEKLVLDVATNQALIGLQEARLLREQKRVATELDLRVAERTRELATANERLEANQELLDLAQKSAGAIAFDWYIQAEINYWSAEQEALFGLPPGGFDGTYRSWKKMMYAPDWPIVVAALQHAHQTGQVEAEYRVVWPDGSLHWLATNGRMFFDEVGNPRRMVGFTSDVTNRKLIEEELRRSEAFLAEGQNLARLGNFAWQVGTGKITWSEQLYHIFEFAPETEMSVGMIGSRTHPDDLVVLAEMVEKAERGVSDFEFEHRLLMPDGRIKHLQLIAHRNSDPSGPLEYLGAVQDVSQRRFSEEALGRARSELAHTARALSLGVLTASIAHEVNQPLSGIITNASTCVRMLDADPPNVDGARETARRTIRDGNRASEVIKRLRSLFSKKDFTAESIDLNEITQEVIALSRSELQRGQVIMRAELAAGLPPVSGDRVQLQQVILNLLLNASDAMVSLQDRPRQLTVLTEPDGKDHVRLSVCDVGHGFANDTAEKLFDAFYTTKESGMGIGLSVSRSIIEQHQGRLWAAPNQGPGAVFSFSLPAEHEQGDKPTGTENTHGYQVTARSV